MDKRKMIEKAAVRKMAKLEKAVEVMSEIEMMHQRGDEWVLISSFNAMAVEILKKLGYLTVIKFNDGGFYGQIVGSHKNP